MVIDNWNQFCTPSKLPILFFSSSLLILEWKRNGECSVHLVLHPHGIPPTFLKLDSWSPGAGFIPIITNNVLNHIKKEKLLEKKLSLMDTKIIKHASKNVGAVPYGCNSMPTVLVLVRSCCKNEMYWSI